MDRLNEISKTALITLAARVNESKRCSPILEDPVGTNLLGTISRELTQDTQRQILSRKIPSSLGVYIALRARYYDRCACQFLRDRKNGLVVSLGAGFDTRYWRIFQPEGRYVEVDLPAVVNVKKQLLGERAVFEMIGHSVLEEKWLDRITTLQSSDVLLLAEGLFMYLPPDDVQKLFYKLDTRFTNSEIVFEVVHEKYTRGMWKKMVQAKMERKLGSQAGQSYQFGVMNAKQVESLGNNIRVLDEWSYLEDPDVRPRFLRLFRNIRAIARAQWTIRAKIGDSSR